MDRDEFIITVYCLVCEHYGVIKNIYPLRRDRPRRRPLHHLRRAVRQSIAGKRPLPDLI